MLSQTLALAILFRVAPLFATLGDALLVELSNFQWMHSDWMDNKTNYKVFWKASKNVEEEYDEIEIGVWAATSGWIGFGKI